MLGTMNTPPFLLSSVLSSVDGIRHGFFTRRGGVSDGIFDSLNCGLASGDELDAVHENRLRVAGALSVYQLYTLKQVHSAKVVVVDEKSNPNDTIEADGLVTRCRGIGLGALGADCPPVLFVDPVAGVIGSAHCGWKGALSGVTDQVIETMCDLGAQRQGIVAAVGPGIQWSSYEVGDEFRQQFLRNSPIASDHFFKPFDKSPSPHFNLTGYIEERLKRAGIGAVDVLDEDTYTQSEVFFSYRRSCHHKEPGYGRQVSVISLESPCKNQDEG